MATVLELVMCSAVDECNVVLCFVTEHCLFRLEVLTRLVRQFDGVRDSGILTTALHEVVVCLFGHLWHSVPFCYTYTIAHCWLGVQCNDEARITLDKNIFGPDHI